ncbi:MAG: hypothetical protein E5V37_01810 [Mesorhizobium sp.]|uniref:hypothetical protein n=1 Tax=unclassified Mesorhizobium TaxID=325217 RepID=UPI000FCADB9F|nr:MULTISPECIES: hypothetical protein [unclassified Mesorhizobium]RUW41365.1 hypothetical protein EOA37_10490 [Mesorhizobium sp. M2A.F.Ca.ET.015.02.1.1]RVC97109.1 hypothetical protein EN739_05905 [Mesorhizobium sp. M2A.F.Ca.ET.017.03.2.1]RVD09120.1 hypothetical protein EN753_11475 [Mesorhizobium sp. M2A.F.Ca.ET.029.05.1.1]RWC79967.1 MAG: hypothetical protein EOS31_24725 [Mesorhizobium sp.]RWF58539.1 MAG: hypothetical protein EOS66_07900 [Mesorhizobium sp.]
MQRVLFFLFMSFVFPGLSFGQEVINTNLNDFTKEEIEIVTSALSDGLFDPYSAKISDLFHGMNKGVICGRINAKNRMGGYVGYAPFYVYTSDRKAEIVRQDPDESPDGFILRLDLMRAVCKLPPNSE